ncbi:hypothetical protein PS1_026096 [Malus domestica]
MATDGFRWQQVSSASPRKINVQKFAKSRGSELETLHSIKDDKKNVPHRIRRRAKLKMNLEKDFNTSGDGTRRLRTHVWHAKRFTMTKLWGYNLPLGLQGRGRGSRAVLKWCKDGMLVHNASYHAAIQLEGPEDSLLSVLGMVMVPPLSTRFENVSRSVISGLIYDNAMLHHLGEPLSKPIASVNYM